MFKKYIGQDTTDPSRQGPAPVDSHASEPSAPVPSAPVPQAPTSHSPVAAPSRPVGGTRNVLSSDVEIKGTVKFTNDLVVDGKIEGEITSDGNLTVGENARIKAEIKTGTLVVYGKIHGNITVSERVELKAGAEIVGDIKTKTLAIEAGAVFVGRSTVGTPAAGVAAAPAKPAEAPKSEPAKSAEAPAAS